MVWLTCLHLKKLPLPSSQLIFVKMSTSWGIGLVVNGEWNTWCFLSVWKSEGRDIGWADMIAVEIVTGAIIAIGFSDVHLVINSDNMGVVGALKAGQSCNSWQNLVTATHHFAPQLS